ncbi:MAG: SDR family NAD(P)-dependent oxidoreductase [Anaerolineales bacterium]|nr:SDR family NAD(P)-dependent oxidoreductase [Anaerolineales bacterium]
MKVFLTGGTGFIGQPLTRAFQSRGWNVVALVRNPDSPQAQALSKIGAQLIVGDITRRESIRETMDGADMVVHNAGHYEYGLDKAARQRMETTNVMGTDNVLAMAHELGIQRTLYVSTAAAFGDTGQQERDESFTRQAPCRTTYEKSKTEAHRIADRYKQDGLPLIIVCPNSVVGANDHSSWGYFLRLYINRIMPPMAWSPNTIHGCVFIEDLAEGIALAAEKGRLGETYLFSGECLPLRQHLSYWSQRPGAYKPHIWLPGSLAAVLFTPLEPAQRQLGLPAFISRETVVGSSTNWYFSSHKAKVELGWHHRSAEAMWLAAIDGELELLTKHRQQNLIQRLNPLENMD